MHYTDRVLQGILGSLGVKYKECSSHVCSLVDSYHDFGGTCCLCFVGRRMNFAGKIIQIQGKEKQEHRTE
jgi:hypothetical protein